MSGSPNRRFTVDVPSDDLLSAWDLSPHTTSTKDIVKYSDHDFKHAPKYREMKPYVKCLDKLLKLTGGVRINQVCCRKGFEEWARNRELHFDSSACERAAYAIRAMISQMANQKRSGREVPRESRGSFTALQSSIQVSPIIYRGCLAKPIIYIHK